jgi:hypothetical protein
LCGGDEDNEVKRTSYASSIDAPINASNIYAPINYKRQHRHYNM